jgi:ketosteroid isomerase-like protein
MKRPLFLVTVAVLLASGLRAQTRAPAPDAPELTKLLQDFLAGASRNDAAMHDRFWADDLIYTTSAGQRKSKDDIMKEVRAEVPADPGDEKTVYSAEDIRIQQYGDTAIVAFRLVGTTEKKGKKEVAYYLNTGTFLKRDGKWQTVAWQATKMPEKETPKPKASRQGKYSRRLATDEDRPAPVRFFVESANRDMGVAVDDFPEKVAGFDLAIEFAIDRFSVENAHFAADVIRLLEPI